MLAHRVDSPLHWVYRTKRQTLVDILLQVLEAVLLHDFVLKLLGLFFEVGLDFDGELSHTSLFEDLD